VPEHGLLLPSATDLVRAFIAELGNVLEAGATAKPAVRVISFYMTAAGTLAWNVDEDSYLVGIYASTHGVLSLSAVPYATFTVTGVRTAGILWGSNTNTGTVVTGLRIFIPQKSVVTLATDVAGIALQMWLEPPP